MGFNLIQREHRVYFTSTKSTVHIKFKIIKIPFIVLSIDPSIMQQLVHHNIIIKIIVTKVLRASMNIIIFILGGRNPLYHGCTELDHVCRNTDCMNCVLQLCMHISSSHLSSLSSDQLLVTSGRNAFVF
jgi:hypothetical protein